MKNGTENMAKNGQINERLVVIAANDLSRVVGL
jgi:hypothetical protein